MYSFREAHGPVELAFTDRLGGVSAAPYDSLNLALVGGDDPAATTANLRRVIADFAPGCAVADMHQVHGGRVELAAPTVSADGAVLAERPECDGLVAEQDDLVLLVRAADCVPVVLADPAARIVGVAHCGRPGLVARILPRTVARLRLLGATELVAWVGPHVCGACYEVPREMQDEVAAAVPAARATTSWGTPSLDLGAGVRAQLEEDRVDVVEVGRCTRESDDLYSYRRDGAAAGRLAGLVRLRGGAT